MEPVVSMQKTRSIAPGFGLEEGVGEGEGEVEGVGGAEAENSR